mgnify:CR=1 FL=1
MLPYNFPRMGMHFPVIHEARSLLRSFPHKAEGPAARRMQAASPFVVGTVPSVKRLYSIGGVHSPPEPLPELPPEPPLPPELPEFPEPPPDTLLPLPSAAGLLA